MDEIPPSGPVDPETLQWRPNQGDYFPKEAVKRRDQYGKFDITTPKHLIDTDEHYVAILTTGENRHPDEDAIIQHYARQQAAKLNGTYDPMEDDPVYLRDLLPTVWVVVNKIFAKHEVLIGGDEAIKNYVKSLQKHIDFDIVPVLCGKVAVLPLHPLLPKIHRDPVFNQHMETYYKNHDKGAKDILDRMIKGREESEKRKAEQAEREAALMREAAEKDAARKAEIAAAAAAADAAKEFPEPGEVKNPLEEDDA